MPAISSFSSPSIPCFSSGVAALYSRSTCVSLLTSVAACWMFSCSHTGIVTIKKLCDGLEITLIEFFDTPEFRALEQEIQ